VAHFGEEVADPQVALRSASSHVMRRNHDGKALNGSSRASTPEGSGSVP
jgi:hypothetical protein